MLFVFLLRFRENQNVINICITEVQTVGNFVYEALKSLSSVFRSLNVIKGNWEFEKSEWGSNGCFAYIVRINRYLMISLYQVNCGKYRAVRQIVREIMNVSDWI